MATVVAGTVQSQLTNAPRPLMRALSQEFSYLVPNSCYTRAAAGGWDGRLRPFHASNGTFPSGLLARVCAKVQESGEDLRLVDTRPGYGDGDMLHWAYQGPGLRDYQQAFAEDVLTYRWGVLHAVPRAGKTIAALHALSQVAQSPTAWVCERVGLARQAAKAAQRCLPGISVGVVGDGDCELTGDLSICTIQSLAAALQTEHNDDDSDYQERGLTEQQHEEIRTWLPNVRVVVVDEGHHLAPGATSAREGGPSYQAVLNAMIGTSHRIGLSATPWSERGNGILIECLVGPILRRVLYEELIERGLLVRPRITFASIPPVAGVWDYQEKYRLSIVEHEKRNELIVDHCKQFRRDNVQTLVTVRRIKHGELLAQLIPDSVFLRGGTPGEEVSALVEAFCTNQVPTLVSTILGEGIDMPACGAVVRASGGLSGIVQLQEMRCLTPYPGKDVAYVEDFFDRTLSTHSWSRLQICKAMFPGCVELQ